MAVVLVVPGSRGRWDILYRQGILTNLIGIIDLDAHSVLYRAWCGTHLAIQQQYNQWHDRLYLTFCKPITLQTCNHTHDSGDPSFLQYLLIPYFAWKFSHNTHHVRFAELFIVWHTTYDYMNHRKLLDQWSVMKTMSLTPVRGSDCQTRRLPPPETIARCSKRRPSLLCSACW